MSRRFESAEGLLSIEGVSRESLPALETYVDLLRHWQNRINLIGPATVPHIWHRHIADSLQLLSHIPPPARTVLDLGSGAGLPGLPIAICAAVTRDLTVHLVEARSKKAAFLREAVRVTGAPCVVHEGRIESLDSAALQTNVDIITARALAPLAELLEYARKPLDKGALCLFLKGREVEAELTEAGKYWIIAAERTPSLTDAAACILKIKEANRVT